MQRRWRSSSTTRTPSNQPGRSGITGWSGTSTRTATTSRKAGEPTTAEEGRNDFGETGYGGPNPPDREHTYRFELYALDDDLDLASSATATDVRDAAEGHVLDDARLEGTYAP